MIRITPGARQAIAKGRLMGELGQYLGNGLVLGAIYALMAAGLTLSVMLSGTPTPRFA